MDNNSVEKKQKQGKFNVSLSELKGLYIETPTNRKKTSEMTDAEYRQQRMEDCKRSAHNSHLKKAIALAEMEALYARNMATNAVLRETKELLCNAASVSMS
jgi:recombinational DNA repair protein RecT